MYRVEERVEGAELILLTLHLSFPDTSDFLNPFKGSVVSGSYAFLRDPGACALGVDARLFDRYRQETRGRIVSPRSKRAKSRRLFGRASVVRGGEERVGSDLPADLGQDAFGSLMIRRISNKERRV